MEPAQKTQKTKISLETIPSQLWMIVLFALCVGITSLALMRAISHFDNNTPQSNYPIYETALTEHGEKQSKFYQSIQGAWYVKKDETESLLELYRDGYFSWESIDHKNKYLKLFAAGQYAVNGQGDLLLSQRKEYGLPYSKTAVGIKIFHKEIGEVAFPLEVKYDARNKPLLSLVLPPGEDVLNPRMSGFLKGMGDEHAVEFQYLGFPSGKHKRKSTP